MTKSDKKRLYQTCQVDSDNYRKGCVQEAWLVPEIRQATARKSGA